VEFHRPSILFGGRLAEYRRIESTELGRLKHIGDSRAERLRAAGFETVRDVRTAAVEELSAIPGVGDQIASRLTTGDVADIEGVGSARAQRLRQAGYQTPGMSTWPPRPSSQSWAKSVFTMRSC
jgi:DNA integrity scanning protein DisA with diadenylate cyclase activity